MGNLEVISIRQSKLQFVALSDLKSNAVKVSISQIED